MCETGPDPVWFRVTVSARFQPKGSGPEASRCARIVRTGSGQRFRVGSGWDANGIRRVYLGTIKIERYLTVRFFTPRMTPSPGSRHPFSNHCRRCRKLVVQELCESRGGRPELSVLTCLLRTLSNTSPTHPTTISLSPHTSPSLISHLASAVVKQHVYLRGQLREFSVALRPQKPSGLLGTGSAGRPLPLSPSS